MASRAVGGKDSRGSEPSSEITREKILELIATIRSSQVAVEQLTENEERARASKINTLQCINAMIITGMLAQRFGRPWLKKQNAIILAS